MRRVVVVEDQLMLRDLLVELIASIDGFTVVGAVGDGQEGLSLAERTRPDLMIVDLVLPGLSGLELLGTVSRTIPETKLLVVTAKEKPLVVQQAIERGAHGIVMKGAPISELKEAIARVAFGRTYYCSTTSGMLREMTRSPGPPQPLTDREREIVRLVASGRSSKQIASELNLAIKTVSNHRLNIMNKLSLHDVASLTRYAIDQGLIDADS